MEDTNQDNNQRALFVWNLYRSSKKIKQADYNEYCTIRRAGTWWYIL